MVDVDPKKLEGEMLDLQHGCTFFPNPKAKINASTGKLFAIYRNILTHPSRQITFII